MPVPAVRCGGRSRVSSGSAMASMGIRCGLKTTVLRLVAVMVMTVERETSLPVPDGGGDGNVGRHVGRDAIGAVQQVVILGQRQLVGDFQADGFGGIERRSAAEADDAVAAILLVDGHAIEHVSLGGIGLHGGEDHGSGRQVRRRVSKTGVRARPASVTSSGREMPRLLQFIREALDRACAEQDGGGKAEGGDCHITMKTHSAKIAHDHQHGGLYA